MASVSSETIRRALSVPLLETNFPRLGRLYRGKVRDNYSLEQRRTIIVTDRISAFDRVLGTLPLKGQVLNFAARFWFEQTRSVVKNHMLATPDPNVMVVEECEPLPVEMVVRAYLTGSTSTSIWVHYKQGKRTFCGHRLPDGLREHQRLPEVLLTPTTKAQAGGHDVSVSASELFERTGMAPKDYDRAASMALNLFREGQKHCETRGLILVDTKYEFGKTSAGEIVVIDEIHTPDSSRFWYQDSYERHMTEGRAPESFDKDYVRRYLAARGFTGEGEIPALSDEVRVEATRRYIEAVEQITGAPFVPNLEEPLQRIARNLNLT